MSIMKNEPKIDEEKYEIHIKVDRGEGGIVWYRWTNVGLKEVEYYTDGSGEKGLVMDPSVMEYKVVKLKKEVTEHFVR
jgi:hypothetical protein